MTTEYKFRFAFTPDWPGLDNMEVDRLLGEETPPDLPYVRFYTWDMPTISYGCNQKPEKRLDLELCRADNIPVVRRPTGGRELLHGHDLCYTVAIPLTERITGVEASRYFADISTTFVNALRGIGINAQWATLSARPKLTDGPCFIQADSGEITVSGKKLVASAQRVYQNCIIQQGSIPLYRPDVDMAKYMRCGNSDEIRRKIDEVAAYLYEISAETKNAASFVSVMEKAFGSLYGTPAGPPNALLGRFSRNNLNT